MHLQVTSNKDIWSSNTVSKKERPSQTLSLWPAPTKQKYARITSKETHLFSLYISSFPLEISKYLPIHNYLSVVLSYQDFSSESPQMGYSFQGKPNFNHISNTPFPPRRTFLKSFPFYQTYGLWNPDGIEPKLWSTSLSSLYKTGCWKMETMKH